MRPIIESRANALVKHLRKLGADRSYRRECGEFLCDGPKLLEEAYRADAQIRDVLVDAAVFDALCARFPWLCDLRVAIAAPGVLDSASAVESPQGVLFSCAMPKLEAGPGGRVLLLDRLQDTGNIGTIIRTADAFGIDAVVADGCADFWNPKTVRATMGALFRVPVFSCPMKEAIDACRAGGIRVYAAVLSRGAKAPSEIDMSRCGVIIGNEGAGVRKEVSEYADGCVFIPMPGQAESLNAAIAASILMWEMTREK